MPHRLRATCVAVLLAGVSFVAAAPAQTSREAEQKLQRVRSELKSIAQERRKLEGERAPKYIKVDGTQAVETVKAHVLTALGK